MGFLGALVYFWQYVESFGTGVFAVIKAVFWPGFLILHIFKFLKIYLNRFFIKIRGIAEKEGFRHRSRQDPDAFSFL